MIRGRGTCCLCLVAFCQSSATSMCPSSRQDLSRANSQASFGNPYEHCMRGAGHLGYEGLGQSRGSRRSPCCHTAQPQSAAAGQAPAGPPTSLRLETPPAAAPHLLHNTQSVLPTMCFRVLLIVEVTLSRAYLICYNNCVAAFTHSKTGSA